MFEKLTRDEETQEILDDLRDYRVPPEWFDVSRGRVPALEATGAVRIAPVGYVRDDHRDVIAEIANEVLRIEGTSIAIAIAVTERGTEVSVRADSRLLGDDRERIVRVIDYLLNYAFPGRLGFKHERRPPHRVEGGACVPHAEAQQRMWSLGGAPAGAGRRSDPRALPRLRAGADRRAPGPEVRAPRGDPGAVREEGPGCHCFRGTGRCLLFSLPISPAAARPAGAACRPTPSPAPSPLPPLLSPEVHPDRRVTFRFRSPNAKEVVLDREASAIPMQKDDAGVWTVTTEPLEPGHLRLRVRSRRGRRLDPSNAGRDPQSAQQGEPGPRPRPGGAALGAQRRRAGHLHRHFYKSAVVGDERDYYVYTPPGYDPHESQPYPSSTSCTASATTPAPGRRWAART